MNTSEFAPYGNFSGSLPKHYEEYLGPLFFEPYAVEIASRVGPTNPRKVLELGCGTGRVTRHLRNLIPASSKLIASDLSEDMLAVAKEQLPGMDIDFRIINAEELPFDNNSFETVVCAFAYMFVQDKPKALAEAYRVLNRGGMLIFSTWDKLELNEPSFQYRKIVQEVLGAPLPEEYNLPYSLSDNAQLKELLQQAGFLKINVESVCKLSTATTPHQIAAGLACGGSVYKEVLSRDPSLVNTIVTKLEKVLVEKHGDNSAQVQLQAIISQAWK